jgi:hypothetical protein
MLFRNNSIGALIIGEGSLACSSISDQKSVETLSVVSKTTLPARLVGHVETCLNKINIQCNASK